MGCCGSTPVTKPQNKQVLESTGPLQSGENLVNNSEIIPQKQQPTEHQRREYKKGELIGRGAFAEVYQGLDIKTGKLLAIKQVRLEGSKDKVYRISNQIVKTIVALKSEIKLLKTLDHRNVIKYLFTEVSPDQTHVDIVLEYIPCGSLRSTLDKVRLEDSTVRVYMKQILEGVAYLHAKGVMHRDLKGANILIDSDGTIKLTDFGTSSAEEGLQHSMKGTPYWMAPEVLNQQGHTLSADIWSAGGVLIEMLTGHPPYADLQLSLKDLMMKIATGVKPPYPPKISKSCKDFLDCMYCESSQRATAEQLLQHAYLLETIPNVGNTSMETIRSQKKIKQRQPSIQEKEQPINTNYIQTRLISETKIKEERQKKQKEWEEALQAELRNRKN